MRFNIQAPVIAKQKRSVKRDPFIKALLTYEPHQIENYIENNVTSMAEAKFVLKKLTLAVAYLAQRE